MYRLSGKIVKKNNIIDNHVFEMFKENTSFEDFLFKGIEALCNRFDIGNPMWLSNNATDMSQVNKTKFRAPQFIEEIDFDYFEIEYLDEHH